MKTLLPSEIILSRLSYNEKVNAICKQLPQQMLTLLSKQVKLFESKLYIAMR